MWTMPNDRRMQSRSIAERGRPSTAPVDLSSPEYLLLRHPLLLGANESKLAAILARIPIQRVTKGALVNDPALAGGFMHLVLLGRLKAYYVNADSDGLLLELIEEGGFDGLLPASGLRGHFSEAIDDSLLALITNANLERLMVADSRVASNLIRMASRRLEARESHLRTLVLEEPVQRLASLLLSLSETAGSRHRSVISMRRLNHKMLGNMLAMRSLAVRLHLRQLSDLGAITVTENTDALQRVVDCRPPCPPRGA